jgi:hypothetical protein
LDDIHLDILDDTISASSRASGIEVFNLCAHFSPFSSFAKSNIAHPIGPKKINLISIDEDVSERSNISLKFTPKSLGSTQSIDTFSPLAHRSTKKRTLHDIFKEVDEGKSSNQSNFLDLLSPKKRTQLADITNSPTKSTINKLLADSPPNTAYKEKRDFLLDDLPLPTYSSSCSRNMASPSPLFMERTLDAMPSIPALNQSIGFPSLHDVDNDKERQIQLLKEKINRVKKAVAITSEDLFLNDNFTESGKDDLIMAEKKEKANNLSKPLPNLVEASPKLVSPQLVSPIKQKPNVTTQTSSKTTTLSNKKLVKPTTINKTAPTNNAVKSRQDATTLKTASNNAKPLPAKETPKFPAKKSPTTNLESQPSSAKGKNESALRKCFTAVSKANKTTKTTAAFNENVEAAYEQKVLAELEAGGTVS